jgi:hypothetical protein
MDINILEKFAASIFWGLLEIFRTLGNLENGGSRFLKNVDTDINLPGYTASHLRTPETRTK